ncbi:unnamed protein product [Mytilus coruscus]|uniref:SRCR domain-containing protein n=1 Tax=Mytilus coruscus TaxID=42192 RepID=A0A6J8EPZ7_MYTCO|nr:unnamed protein product [Mytilus coruscus]
MKENGKNGLCSTLMCTSSDVVVLAEAHCKGNSNIKGVCEDGMPSTTPGSIWNLQQNQAFTNCWKQNKLLLNSSVCQYLATDLKATAWTNIFREEIEIERILGDGKETPKFCLSGNISKSDRRENVLNLHRRNCSVTLEWFVCKNDSTSVRNKNNEDEETASNQGALIGGSVGAVIVLLIAVSVIVCKIRRIGLFKSNNSANTKTVIFTKSVYDDKTNLRFQTQQQVNKKYGLVNQVTEKINKTNDSYTQVQKVKRMEDTYTECTNEEYDHLHNIGGRKPKVCEKTYDSNAGVRNHNDPTYDTATSSTGVDMDNTYDHSFSNMKAYSEYDVSDSRMQIDRTNYDVSEQGC